jgi:hypothetical protein
MRAPQPLLVLIAVVLAPPLAAQTMPSSCSCTGCHGVYRWAAKVSATAPPATIPASHQRKPSDFALLAGPGGQFTSTTPRIPPEQEWFAVTGRVTHVKLEADGDLHVQLLDASAPLTTANGYLVVEIPEGAPWCALRAQVLGWTDVTFPFVVGAQTRVALLRHPVVRVTGRAFYDATHAPNGNTRLNTRPVAGGPGFTGAIWEIHPVMQLTVVSNQ